MANRDKGSDNSSTNVLGNNVDNRGESNDSPRGEKDMKNLMESFTKEQMYVLLGSHLRKAVEGYFESVISLEAYKRADKVFRGGSSKDRMVKHYSVAKKGYRVSIVEQLLQMLNSMPKRSRTLAQAQAILDELSDSGNPKHWKKINGSVFNDNIQGVRIDTSREGTKSLEFDLDRILSIDKDWVDGIGRTYADRVEQMVVYLETGEYPS